jgi:hypothetical protein
MMIVMRQVSNMARRRAVPTSSILVITQALRLLLASALEVPQPRLRLADSRCDPWRRWRVMTMVTSMFSRVFVRLQVDVLLITPRMYDLS